MADVRANVVVSMPSQMFTMARSFKACTNGKIYIGKIDQDPTIESNQIDIYVEAEDGSLTQIPQPVIINSGGFPSYNGQVVKVVTVEGHSMAIYDSYGAQQFYFPNVIKYNPDRFQQEIDEIIQSWEDRAKEIGTIDVNEGSSLIDPSNHSSIEYGKSSRGKLSISSGGVLKSATFLNGVQNSNNITMPYVENTGNIINTDYGAFAEKQLWLPSDKFEDKFLSPSLGITYSQDGMPILSVITPAISGPGHLTWPDAASLGRSYKTLAFRGDVVDKPAYMGQYSDGTRYIQIAKWNLSSIPYNTEYKVMITSSNTDDRFIGSLIVEANIQASGTTLKNQDNLTLANINKYFKARFDGPSDRIAYASGTVHTIPMVACSTDGSNLYLWVVQQSGASGTKVHEIHKGVGTALTTDYSLSNVSKNTPYGRMFIPARPDYNGSNASASNDGHLLLADNHVRVCNTSGSNTSRPDIEQGGFVWGGYGTYKSNRESCSITKSGTGTYVITGPHLAGGWTITQPRDGTGEQLAIAQISSSSDGNTNTLKVYSIKYTYNSANGTVTRGIGDLIDIPSSSWVDIHASTTF